METKTNMDIVKKFNEHYIDFYYAIHSKDRKAYKKAEKSMLDSVKLADAIIKNFGKELSFSQRKFLRFIADGHLTAAKISDKIGKYEFAKIPLLATIRYVNKLGIRIPEKEIRLISNYIQNPQTGGIQDVKLGIEYFDYQAQGRRFNSTDEFYMHAAGSTNKLEKIIEGLLAHNSK